MKFHPLANILPLLKGAAFDELVADIKANGLNRPIVTHDDAILDGRNRFRACEAANVAPRFEPFDGNDPLAFVISENLKRRHLNETQRAVIGAKIANMRQGERTDLPSIEGRFISQEAAAVMVNVGLASIERAATVLKGEGASPALREGLEDGLMTVSFAAMAAKLPQGMQRGVVGLIRRGTKPMEAYRETIKAETRLRSGTPDGKFRIIYADPPWDYGAHAQPDYQTEQRDHYPVMTLDAICAEPVPTWVEDDAVLFLWTPAPFLLNAFKIIEAWGFTYKENFVWDKVLHNMGHYHSVRHEHLLIATRGSCKPDVRKLFDSVQSIERGRFSEKPVEFYEIIETLYPHGRKLEMYCRGSPRPGWEVYGGEASPADEAAE